MSFIGFIVLLAGGLGALREMGALASIETAWSRIGVVIVMGLGVMAAASNGGIKENIETDRK